MKTLKNKVWKLIYERQKENIMISKKKKSGSCYYNLVEVS